MNWSPALMFNFWFSPTGEDRIQDVCAGYIMSDQWRVVAVCLAAVFIAAGWALATQAVFAAVRKGWLR